MVSYPGLEGEEEGFGITFLEANLHGLPVIGSRCGGIVESVEHFGNGILVKPKRPDDVSYAVKTLLDNPQLCSRMAEYGLQRIKTKYNWNIIAKRVEKRIRKVIY
jgi:glycosyltransferase involved in cell wall biosynthesis